MLPIGQSICGVGYAFIISAVAQFPAVWFEEIRRVSAINILWGFYWIGNVIGYVIPVLLIDEDTKNINEEKSQIFYSYLVQCILTVILFLMTAVTFESEPQTPPSRGALVVRDDDIIGTYRELFTNWEFVKLSVNFSLIFSIGETVYLNCFQIGEKYGFPHSDVLLFIASAIGCGWIGIFFFGKFLVKYKWYRKISIAISLSILLNLILFWVFFELKNKICLIIIYGTFGFWLYPIYSLSFSYSTDVAFPLKETTFWGIFLLLWTVFGEIFANLNYYLIESITQGSLISHWLCMILALISVIIGFKIKPINYQKK